MTLLIVSFNFKKRVFLKHFVGSRVLRDKLAHFELVLQVDSCVIGRVLLGYVEAK